MPEPRRRHSPPSRAAFALASAGFRLSDLAEVAGITEATASRWLSGKIGVRAEELEFALEQLIGPEEAKAIMDEVPSEMERQAA